MRATVIVLAVFILFGGLACGQDNSENPQSQPELQEKAPAAVNVFKHYKDCVVEVAVVYYMEDGAIVNAEANTMGSGFFVDKEGRVLTACHVVREIASGGQNPFRPLPKIVKFEYFVILRSKNITRKAELLGWNKYSDLALLRVVDLDPALYNAAKLGSPDSLKVGERIYTFGSPFGLSLSMTEGSVGALHRVVDVNYLEDFIQTDASINPGNSGGPLVNSRGEVVGVNTLIARGGGNFSLAVSMKLAKLDQLEKGEAVLPWFGAEALIENFPRGGTRDKPAFRDLATLYRLTGIDNVKILDALAALTYAGECWAIVTVSDETTAPDGRASMAKKIGLKRGDLIVKINGRPIRSGMDVRISMFETLIGREFEITFVRPQSDGMVVVRTVKAVAEKKPNGNEKQ